MRVLRPTAVITAFLIVAILIPPSLFSQTAARQRQSRRPQRGDALGPAINKLLKTNPLAPESSGEEESEENASEDEKKPPADDAPIKELAAYWFQNQDTEASNPSDKVRQRLLEVCEDRPEFLLFLTKHLPETPDTHDRIYKLLSEESEYDALWKPHARDFLRRNSSYFRDELISASLESSDSAYPANEDLRALARLDWNTARPILESLASAGKTFLTPVALVLLYDHAVQEKDSARTESYRALLKAIVENRKSGWSARVEVLASLMNGEWSGQEEWFISLFADPTLSGFEEDEIESAARNAAEQVDIARDLGYYGESQSGVLATVLNGNTVFRGNADRWLPVIGDLLSHNHPTVHKAAVKCMVGFLIDKSSDEKKKKDIALLLSPLLTAPDRAAKEDRALFIGSLSGLNMPELAPGLIWVLDHDEDPNNRAAAAKALALDRDQRSIPALRRALEKENEEVNRESIVTALAECGGLSDEEMAEAIEAYASMVVTDEGKQKIDNARYSLADLALTEAKPLPLKVSIGRILNDSETIQATEGLALRLIERAKALRAARPEVAREILRSIEAAPLSVVEINLVERIGEGWADIDSITLALENRDTLMKSAGDELFILVKKGGYAAGVAAAILKDEGEWKSILEKGMGKGGENRDVKAQLALLASARYLRDKLPVELAARLLDPPNNALAKAAAQAAESYLEIEDSPEARKSVLARHPGEAYILGDITPINIGVAAFNFAAVARNWEDRLRKEIRGRNGPEAIYAVARIDTRGNYFGVIIRARGGNAEMSVHETPGRRNVRRLTGGELDELKSFTSRPEIEDLGPESYSEEGESASWAYEYLRLAKEGGRRIVLSDLRRTPKDSTLHEELSGLFYRLSRSGEFITRYDIEDKITGVEVVFADKNLSVSKVCAEGNEIRALIVGRGIEYSRGGSKAEPEWREFSSGKPGEVRNEPSACRNLTALSDGVRVFATGGEDGAIWKSEPGMDPVRIASGNYFNTLATPDGKWLVSNKLVTDEGKTAPRLIRRNLQSGEEFVISLPQNTGNPTLVYVAAHGKFLASSYRFEGMNNGYLIAPETGTVQPVKGELGPLIDSLAYPPQQWAPPNLFWTTIYDVEKRATKFGKYDSKNFIFTSLLEIPELALRNDNIWVDEAGGKIWFVYEGHLLRLPIPAQTK